MKLITLPARFPVTGAGLHRHAAKVQLAGIDMLAELHHAERHVTALSSRPLSSDERRRFREAIRSAHHSAAVREGVTACREMAIACAVAAPVACAIVFYRLSH